MSGASKISHILKNDRFWPFRSNDLHNVEKQGSPCLVSYSELLTRFREWLTWKARAEDIMIWDQLVEFVCTAGLPILGQSDASDVGWKSVCGQFRKCCPVDSSALVIHFARHDTAAAQLVESMVKPTDTSEQVDESKACFVAHSDQIYRTKGLLQTKSLVFFRVRV